MDPVAAAVHICWHELCVNVRYIRQHLGTHPTFQYHVCYVSHLSCFKLAYARAGRDKMREISISPTVVICIKSFTYSNSQPPSLEGFIFLSS